MVEVSLLRTGAYVLGWDLGLQMTLGKVAGAESRQPQPGAAHEPLPGRRRSLVLLHGLGDRAPSSPAVLPRPRPSRPARGPTLRHSLCHPQAPTEVIAILDEIIAERPLAEWAERFDREGVWWAPAQSPARGRRRPAAAANDGFVETGSGAGGPSQRSVNGPVTFSAVGRATAAPAPALGQHTGEVIAELGERLPTIGIVLQLNSDVSPAHGSEWQHRGESSISEQIFSELGRQCAGRAEYLIENERSTKEMVEGMFRCEADSRENLLAVTGDCPCGVPGDGLRH